MKIVVQSLPDQAELILDDLDEEDFVIDQNTYYYFRDDVFIKGMEKFINKVASAQFKDIENYRGAEKVEGWYDNQKLIVKYYPQYNKIRDRFYLYKGEIYAYEFLGFMNVGNEIQLLKLDMEDALDLLNKRPKKSLQRFIEKLHL